MAHRHLPLELLHSSEQPSQAPRRAPGPGDADPPSPSGARRHHHAVMTSNDRGACPCRPVYYACLDDALDRDPTHGHHHDPGRALDLGHDPAYGPCPASVGRRLALVTCPGRGASSSPCPLLSPSPEIFPSSSGHRLDLLSGPSASFHGRALPTAVVTASCRSTLEARLGRSPGMTRKPEPSKVPPRAPGALETTRTTLVGRSCCG